MLGPCIQGERPAGPIGPDVQGEFLGSCVQGGGGGGGERTAGPPTPYRGLCLEYTPLD